MRSGFFEEVILSGIVLLCAAVSPNIFPAAQGGYANMSTLAVRLLIPSIVLMAATVMAAKWRGHRRLVNRVLVGIIAGVIGTVGLEAVRITSFRVFSGMPGDLPQLLGVLLLNRFAEGPSALSNVVGYLYHFWNGACFGIIFSVIFGKRRWFLGSICGEIIGIGFLLSPATTAMGVGFMASQMPKMQITIALAHLVFGSILGILCYRWIRDSEWLLGGRRGGTSTPAAQSEHSNTEHSGTGTHREFAIHAAYDDRLGFWRWHG